MFEARAPPHTWSVGRPSQLKALAVNEASHQADISRMLVMAARQLKFYRLNGKLQMFQRFSKKAKNVRLITIGQLV